jgi:hypothetical protein
MNLPLDTLATLRQVNNCLRSALVRLRPERQHCSTIKPQDFSDLCGEILRAADCMRRISLDPQAATQLKNESFEYRSNLEQLNKLLPDVQARLLVEKSRLECAQSHVAAAAAWVGITNKCL